MRIYYTIILSLLANTLFFADAAIITSYDFEGGSTSGFSPTSSDVNVTSTNFSTGAGLSGTGDIGSDGDDTGLDAEGNNFGSTANQGEFEVQVLGGGSSSSGVDASSYDNAIAINDYITFTVTPDSGFELNLTSLTFKAALRNDARGAEFLGINSSVDGFTSADTITTDTIVTEVNGGGVFQSFTISLAGAQFQNITSAVEFRIYLWGAGSTPGQSQTYFDKVVLNGAVVPEPSSVLLLSLGLCSVLFRRNR